MRLGSITLNNYDDTPSICLAHLHIRFPGRLVPDGCPHWHHSLPRPAWTDCQLDQLGDWRPDQATMDRAAHHFHRGLSRRGHFSSHLQLAPPGQLFQRSTDATLWVSLGVGDGPGGDGSHGLGYTGRHGALLMVDGVQRRPEATLGRAAATGANPACRIALLK
jgi:hypothetical protein